MKLVLWEKQQDHWGDKEKEEYQLTLEKLEKIKQKWNISFQAISDYDPDDVYRTVFLKNRTMLKKRTTRPVNDLRSNKGYVYINGVVGVFDSDEILYYEQSPDKMQFLDKILAEGSLYVEKIIEKNLKDAAIELPEDRLVIDFITKAKTLGFAGEIRREVPIVRPIKDDPTKDKKLQDFIKSFSYMAAKFIDMVHFAKDNSYDIIEAKVKLKWEAIGQVLGYKQLFCQLNSIPQKNVRTTIVCRETDGFIEWVCDELGIKVIRVEETEKI